MQLIVGCRRYDGAIQGFEAVQWRKDDLTGMPTEKLLSHFTANRNYKFKPIKL
jgi:hydroxymethylglutaryl-CoA lyase